MKRNAERRRECRVWALVQTTGVVMRFRVLFAAAATVFVAACGESSTTAPQQLRPGTRSNDLIICRSGYHVATRADGTQYCEPDETDLGSASSTTTTSTDP